MRSDVKQADTHNTHTSREGRREAKDRVDAEEKEKRLTGRCEPQTEQVVKRVCRRISAEAELFFSLQLFNYGFELTAVLFSCLTFFDSSLSVLREAIRKANFSLFRRQCVSLFASLLLRHTSFWGRNEWFRSLHSHSLFLLLVPSNVTKREREKDEQRNCFSCLQPLCSSHTTLLFVSQSSLSPASDLMMLWRRRRAGKTGTKKRRKAGPFPLFSPYFCGKILLLFFFPQNSCPFRSCESRLPTLCSYLIAFTGNYRLTGMSYKTAQVSIVGPPLF